MSEPPRHSRGWIPVAAVLIAIDQVTKAWAVSRLATDDIDLFWTLRFNLSYNTGMAFGRGSEWGPVIAVIAMLVIVGLLLGMRRQPGRLTDLSVGLIIGGAIGNLIDRLVRGDRWLRGGVVDFIDFQWFPIFNVADMGITVGGALLVLASYLVGRQLPEEAP